MTSLSPAVAQWALALRLRKRRAELGLSAADIAKKAGFTRNYWSLVENDRTLLSEEKLGFVGQFFQMEAEEIDELQVLRRDATERGWWREHMTLYSDEVLRFYGMEHGASSIRVYQNLLIPALLQSEEYVYALVSSDIFVRPAEVDQLVEVRMRRQQRLSGDNPLQFSAVMSEAALLQQIGGHELQRKQLQALVDLIEDRPETIDLRILPFTANGRGLLGSSTMNLLEFAGPSLPALVWHESVSFHGFIEEQRQVRDLDLIYRTAQGQALSKADTLVRIKDAIKRLE